MLVPLTEREKTEGKAGVGWMKQTRHLFCCKLRSPLDIQVDSSSCAGQTSVDFREEVRARDTNLKILGVRVGDLKPWNNE